jgi:iron complex outermembrane recepter protein
MLTYSRLHLYSSIFFAFSSLIPSQVLANDADQSVDSSSEKASDEIIVTAQKREERLRDVPMSITAATSEQLQSRGVTTTDDLAKIVPGFAAQKTNNGLPIYFIRGVGFFDASLGVSPAVTVYSDQAPIPFTPMARGAILDLERVEVLKGPQGTLFGQNATGGAINYISAKPTDSFEAGVNLQFGRFAALNTEGFVSGPLSSTVSARVAVRGESSSNWQSNYANGDKIGERRFINGRAIVDFKPSDNARFELQVTGWRDKSDSQQPQLTRYIPQTPVSAGGRPTVFPIASFAIAPNNPRAAAWDPGRSFARDDWYVGASLRGDVDLSDTITLTSISSYGKYRTALPQDGDATIFALDLVTTRGSIKTYSQELRIAQSQGAFQWMLGGNYQNDRTSERQAFDPVVDSNEQLFGIPWDSFGMRNDQRIKTASVFASAQFQLSDTLTVQGSARYSDQKRDYAGCTADLGDGDIAGAFAFLSFALTGTPQTIPAGGCITLNANGTPASIITSELDEDNFSWRGSVNWNPSDSALVYANITKGYKAGSFPTLAAAVSTQLAGIKQESVLAYEIGTKIELADRKVQIDGAAFYYDYTDKQLTGFQSIFPFGPLPSLVSIPKARVQGVELNVILRPVAGLTLTVGGSHLKTKVLRDPPAPIGPFGGAGTFVGQRFPLTPKWQGVADLEYRFPALSNGDAFFGATLAGRTGSSSVLFGQQPAQAALEQLLVSNGYATLDLRAGIDLDANDMRVEIWGRNVTNRYYSINNIRSADSVFRFAGQPATYGISLNYRFQ